MQIFSRAHWQVRFVIFILLANFWLPLSSAQADVKFINWIDNFYATAAKAGITRQTYIKVFENIKAPDPRILKRANFQPEFKTKIWDYIDGHVNPYSINAGFVKKSEHQSVLQALEKHFGIDQHILLAIWSMETNYGELLNYKDKLFNAPHALATLAYADRKRATFARQQLVAALQIIQNGNVTPRDMYGSWAGALGQTQFIPTSYQLYAVDADGDGKKDIWRSVPDALATAANLLVKSGWRPGLTWGHETIGPNNAYQYREQTKTLGQWQKLGFKPAKGQRFPNAGERAELKFLAGPNGPAFLLKRNFFVIKKYNNANSYALSVGLLADRLAGGQKMAQRWPRPSGALNVDEKVELQKGLASLGLYRAEFDGNIGSGSRAAIAEFQRRNGMVVDEKASQKLLEAVKRQANI